MEESQNVTQQDEASAVSSDDVPADTVVIDKADASEIYDTSLLQRHIDRQVNILRQLGIQDRDLGHVLEKALFTPVDRPEQDSPDPRLNFYPPFLTPECLALHYPFFMNVPIPMSCRANRCGTDIRARLEKLDEIPTFIPDPMKTQWSDALGNVDLIADLKDNQKFAHCGQDYSRIKWFKSKAESMTIFAYPCIALPPSIHKVLVETFIGKTQKPNRMEKYTSAISDRDIEKIWPKKQVRYAREVLNVAIGQQVLLRCMTRFFDNPKTIKNIHDSLHYMFNHGFVRIIRLLTDVDLSEFVTYHGITHRNRLNNSSLHRQLEGHDKSDYILDTIYLFLVFLWQTAMDIWQQTMDESTIVKMTQILDHAKLSILKLKTPFKISRAIAEMIFPDIIQKTFTENLPDFVNQAQMNNFRLFILSKSGVPQAICPMLPSDCIPCDYTESHPVLWCHVLLLRLASFIKNQGCYDCETPSDMISAVQCECNLCSPHKMPSYNSALMQEITSINRVNIQKGQDSEGRTFSLTPQAFANAYLSRPCPEFFYDKIKLYKDQPEAFPSQMEACIIKDKKLLAALKEVEIQRESELLKRGRGIYLDPETGEPLSEQDECRP